MSSRVSPSSLCPLLNVCIYYEFSVGLRALIKWSPCPARAHPPALTGTGHSWGYVSLPDGLHLPFDCLPTRFLFVYDIYTYEIQTQI